MKNPLVDALRQANGHEQDVAAEESRVTVSEELPLSSETAKRDDTDLELLDASAAVLAEQEPASGESFVADIDAMAESASALVVATDATAANSLAATAILAARGASLETHSSILPKVGRLAPILCLIAMSVAAGGSLLIDRLSSKSLNEDLDGLSARSRLSQVAGGGAGTQVLLPVTDVSVVRRTAARNALVSETEQEQARISDQVGVRSDVNPDTTARMTGEFAMPRALSSHTSPSIDDRAYDLVVTAFAAYRQQDYEVAEENYRQALDIEPYHRDALAGLGAVYQQTGRSDLAGEYFQKLLSVDPGNTMAASAVISLRSAEDDWEAESELKHLLQRFPLAHHLHFALAAHFVEQGRWADARYEFRAAQELAPHNADYNFNLAVSLERLGEPDEARRYYELAIATAGESANVDKQLVARHLTEMSAHERERL